ncbi:hypothetical protein H9649_14315 [Sporosarcina sp. Sa2YVA2]|uniref:Spore coat protein n=1 Tax=Sporosarcina quadrami TaxID=2762234 RepID=A0ABR8UCK0_9BACL|nr:hypothetical protein [Sporosarcina quadrami]MBD7985760.1 hypothetical protein [Sporosarcina quadrami]
MDEKKTSEQLEGLSGQLMELFVANLLTKHNVDISNAKKRMTDEQREHLKGTVEKLKEQVEDFLETKTVIKKTETEANVVGQAESPLRKAFMERRKKKENEKPN